MFWRRKQSHSELSRFEQILLPHQGAAYNLARWLTQNDQDAEDVLQEAYVRAFQFFGGYQGGDSRSWLLRIVRNTCYTWLKKNWGHECVPLDNSLMEVADTAPRPESQLMHEFDRELLRLALMDLPVEFREVVVLRDLEGLSYKEIAVISEIPLGTVMSRLARARRRLEKALASQQNEEQRHL